MYFPPLMVEVLSFWLKDMIFHYQLSKSIPDFTSKTSISFVEHIQEISNVCNIHGFIEDDVFFRLIASSLKEKALQQYKDFPHNSITNWDG